MPAAVSFSWPDLVESRRIPDQAFARAYVAMSDVDRSWIKKNIAQLYALYPPNQTRAARTSTHWHCGFASHLARRPRQWALVLLSGSNPGPARTLAALLPAVTSGIPHILVALSPRHRRDTSLLTSLELCGAELVCCLGRQQFQDLLHQLAPSWGQGAVLSLGNTPPSPSSWKIIADSVLHGLAYWQAPLASRIALWCENPGQWLWDVLQWNHPGAHLEAWGPWRTEAPEYISRMAGDWDAFCDPQLFARGVPRAMAHDPRLPEAGLLLTPGQEGCWVWPELSPDLFLHRGMTVANSPELSE
jgi:hypothetical protein